MGSDGYPVTLLRVSLICSLFLTFISGPSIPVGPIDLQLIDFGIVAIAVSLSIYIYTKPVIQLFFQNHIWLTALVYFSLAILLPILGLLAYENPVAYFVGDIRWFQALLLGGSMLVLYGDRTQYLVYDLTIALTLALGINLLFFTMQSLSYNDLVDTTPILDVWYLNQSTYGDHGYHIGRYAGAETNSSGLGLLTAISIAVFATTYITSGQGQGQLIVAFGLLIASGHRTSMVAVMGIIAVITTYQTLSVVQANIPIRRIAMSGFFISVSITVLYYFNIGRIATSDRYRELASILLGPGAIAEVSGRADRWEEPLTQAGGYPLGTLSNPAWVLNDLQTIDSYFVITYLQGGVIFLLAFCILLAVMAVFSIRLLFHDPKAIIPLGFTGTIFAFSLMQNFATSISGKVVLVLCVVILLSIIGNSTNQ